MIFNTHTHCEYSPDGNSTIAEYITKARKLGVSYLAMTDHFDDNGSIASLHNYIEVFKTRNQVWADYQAQANKQGLYLASGIEIGYSPQFNTQKKLFLDKGEFDYIINSVHWVDGESCYTRHYFDSRTKLQGERRYLEVVLDSLYVPYQFDCIGHFGYPSRNAPFSDPRLKYSDHIDILDKIFSVLIQKQIILELNTFVYNSKSDTLPNDELLQQFKHKGGELITFSSDAHHIDRLIDGWDSAKTVAINCGYTHYAIKKQGKIEMVAIDC